MSTSQPDSTDESASPDIDDSSSVERERAVLRELAAKPLPARWMGYVGLSGPGWLQSAITLGGGSLTGSLYLGVLAGFSMLWLQPLAMILGIIMLSAIGYVTLSTGERPFRAINQHVTPVLGWAWLIATLMANMVWALPQYSLATAVLQQNLFPDILGAGGSLGDERSKLIIVGGILLVTTLVTWSYGSGHWGVRVYEAMLKIIVALIVLSFVGVVLRMATSDQGIDWTALAGGFVPDFGSIFRPAAGFTPMLEAIPEEFRGYWTDLIVSKQRDVLMTAFATAVGINMTFLLPYSMLGRGWAREHRGLATFDLSTGMFIPFVIATSCVVIASANQFYTQPYPGLLAAESETTDEGSEATPPSKAAKEFAGLIDGRIRATLASDSETSGWSDDQRQAAIDGRRADVSDAEERLAATLVTRDAQDLARSLQPLFEGRLFADVIFGFGVLGMALSTISLLMLISGFVVCEVLDRPSTGWLFRFGTLAAATGALGPFYWSKAAFWLAVPTSVFGLVLLPIAYLTFLLLINQRSLLGDQMLSGIKRLAANIVMTVATAVAIFASGWAVWSKSGALLNLFRELLG